MFDLQQPRHIPTLPIALLSAEVARACISAVPERRPRPASGGPFGGPLARLSSTVGPMAHCGLQKPRKPLKFIAARNGRFAGKGKNRRRRSPTCREVKISTALENYRANGSANASAIRLKGGLMSTGQQDWYGHPDGIRLNFGSPKPENRWYASGTNQGVHHAFRCPYSRRPSHSVRSRRVFFAVSLATSSTRDLIGTKRS